MHAHRVLLGIVSLCLSGAAVAKPPVAPEFLNSGKILPANLPFSEAVRADGWLLLAGQIGVEPGSLKLAPGGLKEETRQAMNNIKMLLEEAGSSLQHICKITIYIIDPRYREAVYRVVGQHLKGVFPVSTGIVVSALGRPEWLVEVDAIAVIPD